MKAAIVDADGIARYLPAALARHGVVCVHVRSDAPDVHLSHRPRDIPVEVRHRGDSAATAAELRAHDVDIVVAGTESGVLLADALSAALGTPGNGMSRPLARRNKDHMVRAVRDAGLATADSFAASSPAEMAAWARDLGDWPVVLKPLASAGTDNVRFCHSEREVRTACASIMAERDRYGQPNCSVLGQRFLRGDEYFVNTVSRHGAHHVVEVWRYHKRPVAGGHLMYDYEHPVPPDDPAVPAVSAYTLAVLDALEIRDAAAHTEVMLTADGPVLVESAARAGGSHAPEVVSRCLGTDQIECLAMAIARPELVTEGRLPPYRPRVHLRYVTLISPGDGVVPGDERLAAVRSLESFHEMVLTLSEGTPIPRTVDLATSPGYVYLSSADPDRVEADYRRLRRLETNGLYDPSGSTTELLTSTRR